RRERGREDGATPCGDDERGEEREAPRDPEQPTDEAGLRRDLGVVRLPGLEPCVRPRRRLADVADAEALWMVDVGAEALLQVLPVAVDRRLVQAQRLARRARMLPRPLALEGEVGLRPVPFRRDRREDVREADADRRRGDRGRERPRAPADEGEQAEADDERRDRGARERPEEAGEGDDGEGGEETASRIERRGEEERDDEHVAR